MVMMGMITIPEPFILLSLLIGHHMLLLLVRLLVFYNYYVVVVHVPQLAVLLQQVLLLLHQLRVLNPIRDGLVILLLGLCEDVEQPPPVVVDILRGGNIPPLPRASVALGPHQLVKPLGAAPHKRSSLVMS